MTRCVSMCIKLLAVTALLKISELGRFRYVMTTFASQNVSTEELALQGNQEPRYDPVTWGDRRLVCMTWPATVPFHSALVGVTIPLYKRGRTQATPNRQLGVEWVFALQMISRGDNLISTGGLHTITGMMMTL